jgi:hypothetical protein
VIEAGDKRDGQRENRTSVRPRLHSVSHHHCGRSIAAFYKSAVEEPVAPSGSFAFAASALCEGMTHPAALTKKTGSEIGDSSGVAGRDRGPSQQPCAPERSQLRVHARLRAAGISPIVALR